MSCSCVHPNNLTVNDVVLHCSLTSSAAGTDFPLGVAMGLLLGHPGVITHDSNADACHHSGGFTHLTCCLASLQVYFPWASHGGASGSDWCHHRHDDDCSGRSPPQAHTPAGPRQGGSVPPPVKHQVCVATYACLYDQMA